MFFCGNYKIFQYRGCGHGHIVRCHSLYGCFQKEQAFTGYPNGPRGGAASLRQGWEAVSRGLSLEAYARDHEDLRLAIKMSNP